jgi:hypothetical protein
VKPSELRRHLESLERFQAAYLAWSDVDWKGTSDAETWEQVNSQEPSASRAVEAAGRQVEFAPPGGSRTHAQVGLSAVLVARAERHGRLLDQALRTSLVQAIADLRQREAEERAKRRSPLYWADRAVHLLLSPVGYLIHAVIGVDVGRSPLWGPVARLASLVFEGLGAYAAGRSLGWW